MLLLFYRIHRSSNAFSHRLDPELPIENDRLREGQYGVDAQL
jgi:hypothetical protein